MLLFGLVVARAHAPLYCALKLFTTITQRSRTEDLDVKERPSAIIHPLVMKPFILLDVLLPPYHHHIFLAVKAGPILLQFNNVVLSDLLPLQ